MEYRAPKGTNDFFPPRSTTLRRAISAMSTVLEAYGFEPLETPIFEETPLFVRTIGDATDVVQKEMYTFKDKGDRSITLRPEGTAGAVRAYVENHLDQLAISRLFYVGPMFRYERPQAGRYRQFHQLGAEIFGESHPLVDVEVIDLFLAMCTTVGLTGLSVTLNSVGCAECRPAYAQKLQEMLKDAPLCETCKARLQSNPMRVLDCKNGDCRSLTREVPTLVECLCSACAEYHKAVQSGLEAMGIPYTNDPRLVRGLDYYTRTAFEILIPGKEGAQNAVGGGGRYDRLVEQLGGRPTPAIGFAIGLERLQLLMEQQNVTRFTGRPRPVYFLASSEAGQRVAMTIAGPLRRAGVPVTVDLSGGNFKKQFKNASRANARVAVILGDDELTRSEVAIKDMDTQQQQVVPLDQAAERIRSLHEQGASGPAPAAPGRE